MSTETTHIKTEKQLVPELRFKDFDGEWGSKQLKEITSYVDYRGRGPEKSEQGIFLVTAKNIKKGFIDYKCSKEYVPTENRSIVMSKGLPEVGDILFTTEAPLGNVAQVDNSDIALAQRVIKFRGKTELLNDYLLHFMIGPVYQKLITRKAIGTTVLGISGKELHKTKIQFPSLPEQQKIASFLSAVDEKIQQLTKKKQLLEQYKKGVMQKLFSGQHRFKDENGNPYPDWEEKKISDVCERSTGRSKSNEIVDDGRNIIVDMGAISRVGKLLGTKRTNCVEDYLETTDLVMAKDDIGGGQIIGKVVLIPIEDKYILGDHVYKLKVIRGDVNYIYYSINSYAVNKSFRQKANGTAQIGINNKTVDDQLIPFPPVEEQQKIATYLMSIDSKIESVTHQIAQTQTFKKGLLQQMFV